MGCLLYVCSRKKNKSCKNEIFENHYYVKFLNYLCVMKKIELFFLVAIFAITFASCEKSDVNCSETTPLTSQELNNLLNEKFGIQEKVPFEDFNKEDLSEILQDAIEILEFSAIATDYSFVDGILKVSAETLDTDERVLLVKHSASDDYSVIKGYVDDNEFNVTKNLSVDIQMDAEGMGSIKVVDNLYNTGFESELIYGKPAVVYDRPLDPYPATPLQVSFCLRKSGEGTKECYKREVDEFCDGFIGCAALVTNPTIHLLILAMCSC